jgi:hypothetical protein
MVSQQIVVGTTALVLKSMLAAYTYYGYAKLAVGVLEAANNGGTALANFAGGFAKSFAKGQAVTCMLNMAAGGGCIDGLEAKNQEVKNPGNTETDGNESPPESDSNEIPGFNGTETACNGPGCTPEELGMVENKQSQTQSQTIETMTPYDLLMEFGGKVLNDEDGGHIYFGPESKLSKIFSEGDGAKAFEKFIYQKYGGDLSNGGRVDNFDYSFDTPRFFSTSNAAEHVIGSWENGIAIVVDTQIIFRVSNTMGVSSFFAGRYTEKWGLGSIGPKASDIKMTIEWTSQLK